MRLHTRCEILLDVVEESPIVTMLRPRRGQGILDDRFVFSTPLPFSQYVDTFGNLCQRLTVPAGELRISALSCCEVASTGVVNRLATRTHVSRLPDSALQFTLQSRYCPSDKLAAKATSIAKPSLTGYEQVQAICDYVHDRLDYRYGISDGSTDAIDTLAHGAGVCRDFAHVCIALCRAVDIPARMAVGYLHGLDPMDFHAWFEAYVGDRWYTFDPSKPELGGGRIVIGYGRDAADVAFLSSFGKLTLRTMQVSTERVADEQLARAPHALAVAG